MKFEYEAKDCVAYVDGDGTLRIKGDVDSANLAISGGGKQWMNASWNESEAVKKFYPGDKITITF